MHFNQFVRHLASPQMQMILAYCKHTHARASLGSRSLALLSRNCTALLYTNTHTQARMKFACSRRFLPGQMLIEEFIVVSLLLCLWLALLPALATTSATATATARLFFLFFKLYLYLSRLIMTAAAAAQRWRWRRRQRRSLTFALRRSATAAASALVHFCFCFKIFRLAFKFAWTDQSEISKK